MAEGNTEDSFLAALGARVDVIEFDVLRGGDGRLLLAHDPDEASRREPLSLSEGLDLLAGPRFEAVELDVDLKHPGFEAEVVEALLERGLIERSLVTSAFPVSLERVGRLASDLPRGLSVPRASRDYLRSALAPAALAYMAALRARLPARARRVIAGGHAEALMAHWMLVGPRLVAAVHEAGGRLFAWTVDDVARIDRLSALGVDGIITNDPRLFRARDP